MRGDDQPVADRQSVGVGEVVGAHEVIHGNAVAPRQLAALAPCVVGYGEIGARLIKAPAAHLDGNPYKDWIEVYGGAEYQEVAQGAVDQLDRVARQRIGDDPEASGRWQSLCTTFRSATRLEIGFWDMGLNPPD